ncbi:uncharacterized protein J4E84_010827 [Alternaria hordeiaustralica]|uniref:uncharacterized protein n=1 Tax=Alternaria hordeiaustralica TaxID=1187925 RepID=UPI0020C21263|nr:uncharacterized protein J4E84_010827 [Alternaria hordeiaustralica]KAI4674127.1 hypothetical protein J4E84_010827 [Alternaria hordeiaustralica]
MSAPGPEEPSFHPVARAPAPWKLTAEVYMLFHVLKGLPGGVHGELEGKEGGWDDEGMGKFEGGTSSDLITGPYDELLLVPGNFTVPQPTTTPSGQPHINIPKKAQRISRIYVSQRTTTYNGRLNWNIPKQLARFSFSAPPTAPGASPPSTLTVQVFPPGTKEGDGGAPFFACTLKPWQWIPPMPLNTKYLPLSMAAAQPPLPSAPGHEKAVKEVQEELQVDDYDTDIKKMDAVLVGTQKWRAFDIAAVTPRARGCWVEVHEKKESEVLEQGEENWWPRGLGAWSVGAWMEDVDWKLGEVVEWTV